MAAVMGLVVWHHRLTVFVTFFGSWSWSSSCSDSSFATRGPEAAAEATGRARVATAVITVVLAGPWWPRAWWPLERTVRRSVMPAPNQIAY